MTKLTEYLWLCKKFDPKELFALAPRLLYMHMTIIFKYLLRNCLANFMFSLHWKGVQNCTNDKGHMTKMAAIHLYGTRHSSFFRLCPGKHFFSHVGTFSWVEPELSNEDEVSCSRTQHRAPDETQTHNIAIKSSALYQLS